jgi:adenylate cyclase
LPDEDPISELLKPPPGVRRRHGRIERRLAAMLAVDIAGYSLLMSRDNEGTHRRVGQALSRLGRHIKRAGGQIVSFTGDGIMAVFPSSISVLRCAVRIQTEWRQHNAAIDPQQRIVFRMGISVGEILIQDRRVGGDVVNIAARLEQLARPGGICVTAAVHDQAARISGISFESIGEQQLRNIPGPVQVYRVVFQDQTGAADEAAAADTGLRFVPKDSRPSIAVLPLRNLTERPDDIFFADGIVEDIIVSLAGLRDLIVISRSSTMALIGRAEDLRSIGRTLGVRYIVTGSVRRSSKSIRVSVELTEAEGGITVWADSIDAPASDLFAVQDRIVRRIVSGVAPHVREEELRRALRRHPSSMTAYDLTLQALHMMEQLTPAEYGQAKDLLARAAEIDPTFAMPLGWAAWWHVCWIGQGWSRNRNEDAANAARLAERAIALDPHDALALAVQGHVRAYLFHDYDGALLYFERAVAAGPNHAIAVTLYALTCAYVGRADEAVEFAEHGLRLSPLDRMLYLFHNVLAWANYAKGAFGDAVKWARQSANEAPAFTANLRILMASLVAIGEVDEARDVAARMFNLEPDFDLAHYERTLQPFRDAAIRARYMAHLGEAVLR